MIQEILHFWFEEITPQQWFEKDEAFDHLIKDRFETVYWQVEGLECQDWLKTPEGCLAYVIVLDQLSRNMFRDQAQAFAADHLALKAAQTAVRQGFDQSLAETKRRFLYMPYMHSEVSSVHETAVELFMALGNAMTLDYEYKHKAIIDRFGRYPHRNQILGRKSTAEELEFLQGPDSSF